jgi:hypothetical protein
MKLIASLFLLSILAGCNSKSNNNESLKAQVDSLQHKLNNTYKPGLGEFMSSIQIHHAKLWFAGTNKNWKLADFEIHEMQEALGNIQKYNTDRPEAQIVDVVNPAIDSINSAITKQNSESFKKGFILLTNTCNDCHKSTGHGFNVVTVPTAPPLSNQSFKVGQ